MFIAKINMRFSHTSSTQPALQSRALGFRLEGLGPLNHTPALQSRALGFRLEGLGPLNHTLALQSRATATELELELLLVLL